MVRFSESHSPYPVYSAADSAWPVGSVFISVVNTNPSELLGIGVWQSFGAGRVLVGLDEGQTEFDTLLETGGAKDVTLTEAQIPSHTHTQDAHQHTGMVSSNTAGTSGTSFTRGAGTQSTLTTTNATAVNRNTGGGQPHNNLQPYITVRFWRRVA